MSTARAPCSPRPRALSNCECHANVEKDANVHVVINLSREALAAGVFLLFSGICSQSATCGSLHQQTIRADRTDATLSDGRSRTACASVSTNTGDRFGSTELDDETCRYTLRDPYTPLMAARQSSSPDSYDTGFAVCQRRSRSSVPRQCERLERHSNCPFSHCQAFSQCGE